MSKLCCNGGETQESSNAAPFTSADNRTFAGRIEQKIRNVETLNDLLFVYGSIQRKIIVAIGTW
jgi:hypothetical protein